MIRALTGFSARSPWKVIAVWAVLGIFLTVLSQPLVYRVTETQSGAFLPAQYDSAAALKVAEEKFGVKPDGNAVTLLVARADGEPLTEADERRVGAVAGQLGSRRVEMPAPKEEDPPAFLSEDHSQTPAVSPAMTAP
ncbi:MMPL family transporter, partial [Streptomyces sp. NPDC048270]